MAASDSTTGTSAEGTSRHAHPRRSSLAGCRTNSEALANGTGYGELSAQPGAPRPTRRLVTPLLVRVTTLLVHSLMRLLTCVAQVPYRLLKAFHKIQQRLVRELEKKFSGKDVVIIANRRILSPTTSGQSNARPRSRTLTAVSSPSIPTVFLRSESAHVMGGLCRQPPPSGPHHLGPLQRPADLNPKP